MRRYLSRSEYQFNGCAESGPAAELDIPRSYSAPAARSVDSLRSEGDARLVAPVPRPAASGSRRAYATLLFEARRKAGTRVVPHEKRDPQRLKPLRRRQV